MPDQNLQTSSVPALPSARSAKRPLCQAPALPSARSAKRPLCQAPALPSARSAKRPLLARLAEKQWALTGLGMALLVLLVLPSAQIKLGASQLNGLIGSYTSGGGGWVPCDASGNPLPSGDPGLNSDGSAALLHTGNQPTADNTYPVPKTGADSWWYGCYSPQAPGGGSYPSGGGYPGGGLSTSSSAGNSVSGSTGGLSTIGYYDPVYCAGDRPGSSPQPPDLNGSVTTNGSDTLTAHFLWTGGGPAPTQATFIIHTSVSASASVGYGSSGKTGGLSGTATATLGSDTVTATDGGSSGSQTGGSYQAQQVSPSGNIAAVSLSGSVSTTTKNTLVYATWIGDPSSTYYYAGPGAGQTGASASATAKGSVYPATITLGGTTPDSNGNVNILVGQGCTASLNTPPFSVQQQSGWTWTVSGTTFQDWQPATPANPNATPPTPANPNASYEVDGYGPANQATAHWYWNDPGPSSTPETVTCSATVTPPDGKSAPFTVNVTQNVTVYVPSWTAYGIGGYVQVNTYCPDFQGDMSLWAGPYDGYHGGMDWHATSSTPQTPVAFGTGTVELVQLVTPNRSYTTNTNPPVLHTDPEKTEGLDSYYPVHQLLGTPPYTEGGSPYGSYDDPRIDLNYNNPKSAAMADSFTDYLLYQPPGTDVRWVPLANFTWSTNGSATIPSSGLWGDYIVQGTPSDKAGTVGAGTVSQFTNPPVKVNFKSYHTHPKWTLINTFHNY